MLKELSPTIDRHKPSGSLAPGAISKNGGEPKFPMLALIARLCDALEAEGVRYCHWKSNNALDRSTSGDNDLDLLIQRACGQAFAEIMGRLGFKQVEEPPLQRLPGVISYYGYDQDAKRLVHVHAHYQLIFGHDMTKNYHLPIEKPFLASARWQQGFRTPTPEFEWIVFVLRMIGKHGTWDALLGRQGRLSKTERQEFVYLQALVQQTQVQAILQQHLPWITPKLFAAAVQSLQPGCGRWLRLKTGWQIQRRLAGQTRRTPAVAINLKWWRRLSQALNQRLIRHPQKKCFTHGGAIIAIVGGDGAGKSTVVQELHRWLAKNFAVCKIHLGKPPRSWLTFTVDQLLKVGRQSGAVGNREKNIAAIVNVESAWPLRCLLALRFLCIARDRYQSYAKAQRFATNGGLVISDRYPLPFLTTTDGPVLNQALQAGWTPRFIQKLAQLEATYYAALLAPDLLIVLRIDPVLAVQRRADEEAAWVYNRSREIWTMDWQRTAAYVIDAGQTKEAVLAAAKAAIWSNL